MTTVTFEHDELQLLIEMLDKRVRDLAIEVRHTDRREFRTLLHREASTLRSILHRLGVEEQAAR